MSFERRWRERFVEFATLREDDAGIAGWSSSGLDTRFRFFRRLWSPAEPGALYLDVGCGAGTYTRWLFDQGLRVVGVDYSQPTLVKAQARTPDAIPLCAADGTRLPFRDATFDGVLCFGLLQAMSRSVPVVRELARVLKPGGVLWIDALNRGGLAARITRLRRRLQGKGMHLRYESPRDLRRELAEAGFLKASVHWLPIAPSAVQQLQPLLELAVTRSVMQSVGPVGSLLSHSFVIRAQRGESRQ